MSLQSEYVIGLYRDVNPTKNRCHHNIAYPLGLDFYIFDESANFKICDVVTDIIAH